MARLLRATVMAGLAGAVLGLPSPSVRADTVVAGRSAQALRCAAYVGMAARYGVEDGYLTEKDADTMTWWSARLLDRWVPLALDARLAAYGMTLRELGSRSDSYRLIARHTDWCVAAFGQTP